MFHRLQTLCLRRQMAGNALIEPVLDFCGQMNDLGSHSVVLCKYPAQRQRIRVTPTIGVAVDIARLDDRFQYLSVNNP